MKLLKILDRSRIIAPAEFNRWFVPPASVAIHLCIGSVYAWSIFNAPLSSIKGVVANSSSDWSLGQVIWIFTVAIVFLGLSAAIAGKWVEKVGPRKVGTTAACCWGGGFLISSLGIYLHQLWLLYLGYGVLGGCGLGMGYTSPVSTLIKWFPDRRGMASGLAIMGFGGGAILATPLNEALLRHFEKPPRYLGSEQQTSVVIENDRLYAKDSTGKNLEAVILDSRSAALKPGLKAGVYQVGTGSTGIGETFLVLGLLYFVVMTLAAFSFRIPAEGWTPKGWSPNSTAQNAKMISTIQVDADEALKTPQFYLLWIVLCFNVTAGIGVLGVAKTMMTDIFQTTYPTIVTAGFASTYVLMISIFNMVGRFFWASISDRIGRKPVYTVFFVAGTIFYISIPFIAIQATASQSVFWLIAFYAVTMLIFTMYGGGFATIPAYIADLFGSKFVGGIHGRLLTAWSTAGVLGPVVLTYLRESSRISAIRELAKKTDPISFREKFGTSLEGLDSLIASRSISISRLLELLPGEPDPTSTLYNSTMFTMALLLILAMVANFLIRPVHPTHQISIPQDTQS
ncbi:MAG: hypothetical protein RJA81_626 [Planctomycetota bacterium]